MNNIKMKFVQTLYGCNKHKMRLNSAYSKIKSELPFKVETFDRLDEDKIEHIDQFLFRFSKLQDAMGEKLFTTLLILLNEDVRKKPFIDKLNILERLELIDTFKWIELRKTRNDVAHEYSFNVEEVVDSLNDIFHARKSLIEIYDTIYKFCNDRFDFVKNSEVL